MSRLSHRYVDGEAWISTNGLTFRGEGELTGPAVTLLAAYEDTGLTPMEVMARMTEGKPTCKDGIWHCPSCNRRTKLHHSFCHCCGKKLKWDG